MNPSTNILQIPQSPGVPQDVSALQSTPQAQPTPVPKAPAQPHQSFWERLLPTVGAVGGLLLAPETGGASLLADAALSGLGEGAGKAAENLLSGQKVTQGVGGDVLGGAFGGALGGGAGMLLGKLGAGLTGKGAEGALQAEEQGAKQAAIDTATANKLNYGGIPQKMQANLNLGTHQNLLDSMGYDSTNPEQMNLFSKGGLDINNKLQEALGNSADVKLPELANKVTGYMKSSGLDTTDIQNTPLGNAFLESNIPLDSNTLTAPELRSLRQSVNNQLRVLNTRIAYAEQGGSADVAMNLEKQSKPLQQFQDFIDTKLNNSDINQNISSIKLTPEEETALKSKYGEQQGQNLIDTINGLSDYSSASKAMLPYAQMEDLSSNALNDINNVTGSARAEQRAKFTPGGGIVTPKSAGQVAAEAAGKMGTEGKASAIQHLMQHFMTPTNATRAGDILSNIAPFAGAATTAAATIPAIGQPGAQGQSMQPTANVQTPQTNELNYMLQAATLDPMQFQGLLGQLAPLVQKSQAAQSLLANLPSEYQAAGGAQGFGGGILSNLLSLIPGTAQNIYKQRAAAAAQAGAPFGLTPGVMPSFMATPSGAAQQFGGLQSTLAQMPL